MDVTRGIYRLSASKLQGWGIKEKGFYALCAAKSIPSGRLK